MLSIQKIGHRYILMIPPSVGIEQFRVHKKIVKNFGRFIPVPSILDDTAITFKKHGSIVYLKSKKGHKTHFMPLPSGAIVVISVPKDVDVIYHKDIGKIELKGKHAKAKVAILGDLEHPIEPSQLFVAKKIKEY